MAPRVGAEVELTTTFVRHDRTGVPQERTARVRADESGLWVDDALAVPAADIVLVALRPTEGAPPFFVEVGRWRDTGPTAALRDRILEWVGVAVEDEARGRALIDALGPAGRRGFDLLGVGARRGRFALVAAAGVLAMAASASCDGVVGWVGVSLALMGTAVLGLLLAKRERELVTRIGADGVLARDGGKRRFVPWSAVREVREANGEVHIETTAGDRIDVPVAVAGRPQEPLAAAGAVDVARIAAIVRHAVAAAHAQGAVPTMPPHVSGAREGGAYRAGDVPEDLLWSVLEHPLAPAVDRVQAARSLRALAADATRLENVRSSTANPDLLAVLGRAEELPRAASVRPRVRVAVESPPPLLGEEDPDAREDEARARASE